MTTLVAVAALSAIFQAVPDTVSHGSGAANPHIELGSLAERRSGTQLAPVSYVQPTGRFSFLGESLSDPYSLVEPAASAPLEAVSDLYFRAPIIHFEAGFLREPNSRPFCYHVQPGRISDTDEGLVLSFQVTIRRLGPGFVVDPVSDEACDRSAPRELREMRTAESQAPRVALKAPVRSSANGFVVESVPATLCNGFRWGGLREGARGPELYFRAPVLRFESGYLVEPAISPTLCYRFEYDRHQDDWSSRE